MDLKPVQGLRPFQKFCMSIGELPSSYKESMTYLELLMWFCNYLEKTVIPTINNNAEAVTELQKLFIQLQDFVNNYFDNLDVQQEINNKLDKMSLDGTLENILLNYSKITKVYNTTIEMLKDSSNLYINQKIKTLGYHNLNDGGGSNFIIRLKKITDINDSGSIFILENNKNLVAELIKTNVINIKQFGAIGNNSSDDTLAIQNAINYTSKFSLQLLIPEGTFLIKTINLYSNSYIKGTNKSNSILKRIPSFNSDDFHNFYRHGYMLGYYEPSTRISNISLENFTLDGNKDNLIYNDEVLQRNINNQNIYIRLCDNIKINNIISKNSPKSGVILIGCNNIYISENDFYNCGINMSSTDKNGISICGKYYNDDSETTINYLSKNVNIFSNNCYQNFDEGIMYTYCESITINNNKCYNNGDRGIEGDSASPDSSELNVIITNNNIFNNVNAGITDYGKSSKINFICNSNIFKNVGSTAIGLGIDSSDISNIVISNNIIDNCSGTLANIVSTNIIFNSNIIKNCSGTLTLSSFNNTNFNNNIIYNDSTDNINNIIYLKSINTLNINNNIINNYLNKIYIQSNLNNSINTLNANNNSILNLIRFLDINSNIINLSLNNNTCFDNRETILFESLLSINSNFIVDNCKYNNNSYNSKYNVNTSKINNLSRLNNNDYFSHFNSQYSKPSSNITYQKKGDIVFSSDISSGKPIGWVFDGKNWLDFGIIS